MQMANIQQVLTITSDSVPWRIVSAPTWVTCEPMESGLITELTTINVTVDIQENTTSDDRIGNIVIASLDNSTMTNCTVYQKGVTKYLDFAQPEEYPHIARSDNIIITSNVNWIASTTSPWIEITNSRGSGDGNISFNILENPTIYKRKGNIVVTDSKNIEKTINISQEGKEETEPSFLDRKSDIIEYNGTTEKLISVNTTGSNFSLSVSINEDEAASWLNPAPFVYGTGSGSTMAYYIKYAVLENTTTSNRIAHLTIRLNGKSETFTIEQKTLTLETDTTEIDLPKTVQTNKQFNVYVLNGIEWTAAVIPENDMQDAEEDEEEQYWLRITNGHEQGTGAGQVVFDIDANTDVNKRLGKIEVKSGTYTKIITIQQCGKNDAITLAYNSKTFNDLSHYNQTLGVSTNNVFSWIGTSDSNWITIINNTGTIKYNISQNFGNTDRVGHIIVSGDGLSKTCTITQKAIVSPV